MATEITTDEYRALAELRYRIRHFLHEGDAVAQGAGLEPQMLAHGQHNRALAVKRSGPAPIATRNVVDGHRAVGAGEEPQDYPRLRGEGSEAALLSPVRDLCSAHSI